MDLWELNKYEKELINCCVRVGLRCRYDNRIDNNILCILKCFISWVRERFQFPIRLVIYYKALEYIKAKDGEYVSGTFWGPYSFTEGAYIKIACPELKTNENEKTIYKRIINILVTTAHEISHYYQWVNRLNKTDRQIEYQATFYSHRIINEFLYDIINDPNICPYLNSIMSDFDN